MSTQTNTASSATSSSSTGTHQKPVGMKETITSLVIALMLALVFRGFVVEGFQIPTGSMAPTLLGKHIRFESPHNGYDWTTGPWDHADAARRIPVKTQGSKGILVTDPITGLEQAESNRRLATGDRVFVLKYLPALHSPSRWDVVVFKNPGTHENYIKRLVGLPGEQLAFVDGDLFTRGFVEGETGLAGWDEWESDDWRVARKSERVQRVMFQDVFDSRYAPVTVDPSYRSPFTGSGSGWDGVSTGSSYSYNGTSATSLDWNGSRAITDRNAYNQISPNFKMDMRPNEPHNVRGNYQPFYVSDIALSADIALDGAPVTAMPTIKARGREFRGVVDMVSGSVRVEMRVDSDGASWEVLDQGTVSTPSGSSVVKVEFWHVDQALWLFVNNTLVCGGAEDGGYTMTPMGLAEAATGLTRAKMEADKSSGDGINTPGILSRPEIYKESRVSWGFEGGAFTLHNVRVQRDISYRNMPVGTANSAVRGGHPEFFPTLSNEEYYMCGDNSARSHDSRLWEDHEIVPWVRELIDDRAGMVHEDLVVGKAFVVYWPSMLHEGRVPAPDVGRVRWIW